MNEKQTNNYASASDSALVIYKQNRGQITWTNALAIKVLVLFVKKNLTYNLLDLFFPGVGLSMYCGQQKIGIRKKIEINILMSSKN